MPLDPGIPLSVHAPEPIDPIGSLAKVMQLQHLRLQLDQAQQQAADRAAWDHAFAQTSDPEQAIGQLPGHLQPQARKAFADADKAAAEAKEYQQKVELAQRDYLGMLATGVEPHLKDPDGGVSAFIEAAKHARDRGGYGAQVNDYYQQIRDNPASLPQVVDQMIRQSPKAMELRNQGTQAQAALARAQKPPTPNEWSVALEAAGGDAAKALELVKQNKAETGSEDDRKYERIQTAANLKLPVSPEDAAWAGAYEKRKTLGPEASAAAAGNRQATAIAAQTAQQARAQGFAEQQAGRKELTDKVEQPFRQAQQSISELKDFVHAAQSGNKEAANLQALQATMTAIRQNGLNRINQAEMKLPAGAGNLWDRIQGKIGGLTSGQPIPADLQKDLLQLATIMSRGSYDRYRASHGDIKQRYRLDEQPIAPPEDYYSVRAPDGEMYTFASQADLDAFKKKAGIK